MKFDLEKEKANKAVNEKSIELLEKNGTDFNKLQECGCDANKVVDELKSLFRDKNITWVTFQG